MTTSLSSLVDNHTEGISKVTYKDFDYILEYESTNKNSIKSKSKPCN